MQIDKVCPSFKVSLKYKYNIHECMPMFYMNKTIKNVRIHTQVSS